MPVVPRGYIFQKGYGELSPGLTRPDNMSVIRSRRINGHPPKISCSIHWLFRDENDRIWKEIVKVSEKLI